MTIKIPYPEKSRALALSLVATKYHTSEPEKFFAELCALHGVETETAFRVFHETGSIGFNGNAADRKLRDIIAGPTFLDLPNPHEHWRFSYEFSKDLSVRTDEQFDAEAISNFPLTDMPYFFNILPRPVQRDIAKAIGSFSVDDENFLVRLRSEILKVLAPRRTFLDAPRNEDEIVVLGAKKLSISAIVDAKASGMVIEDKLSRLPASQRLDVQQQATPANYRHFIFGRIGTVLELTQRQYDRLLSQNNDLMRDSVTATARLKEIYGSAASDITPRDVYAQISGESEPTDPLLYVAAKKALENPDEFVPLSPALIWQKRTQEQQQNPLAEKIIEKWQGLNTSIITLAQLAKELGVFAPDLQRLMTSDNLAKNCWRFENDKYVVNSAFEKLCTWLGEKPEDVIAQPVRTLKARVEITAAPPKEQPVKTPWQDMGAERAEELFGAQFDTPQAVIEKALAFMNPPAAQVKEARAALTQALKSPSGYVNEYGHPSLPHLWLMWGIDPDTHKDFSPDTVFTALEMTFQAGADDGKLTDALYAEREPSQAVRHMTPTAALAWAAIKTAHAKHEGENGIARVTSYADFLRWGGMKEASDDKANYRWDELLAFADLIQTDGSLPQRPRAAEREKNRSLALQLQGLADKAFGPANKALPLVGLYGSTTRAQAVRARLEPYVS